MAKKGSRDKPVGDETLQRIDDLAGGWSVPDRHRTGSSPALPLPPPPTTSAAKAPPGKAPPAKAQSSKAPPSKAPPRKAQPEGSSSNGRPRASQPEAAPPPGRAARRTAPPPPPGRKRPSAGPPPPPPGRKKPPSKPPTEPLVAAKSDAKGQEAPQEISGVIQAETDPAVPAVEPASGPIIAPDHAVSAQTSRATGSGSEAADRTPGAPIPEEDADDRDDETVLSAPGSSRPAGGLAPFDRNGGRAAAATARRGNTTGSVRALPTLPRRSGVLGDVVYVYTATVGVTGARRELAAIDTKLESEKEARDRRLVELARHAIGDSSVTSSSLDAGREHLVDLEDQRSRRAGQVAASDEEIAQTQRERDDERERRKKRITALRRQIEEITEKLEPIERKAGAARRKATRLTDHLAELDRRLTREEARLIAAESESKADAAEVEALIASLRAERESVAEEEPALAAELDDLEPMIAGLCAQRSDAEAEVTRLEKAEVDAGVRVEEIATALRARRAVEQRAESDLARRQEDALRALGERLNVERPAALIPRLRPIEEHEVAIATLERRRVELSELVKGVDRWALVRGVVWQLLLAAAIGAVVVWILWFRT